MCLLQLWKIEFLRGDMADFVVDIEHRRPWLFICDLGVQAKCLGMRSLLQICTRICMTRGPPPFDSASGGVPGCCLAGKEEHFVMVLLLLSTSRPDQGSSMVTARVIPLGRRRRTNTASCGQGSKHVNVAPVLHGVRLR